MGDISTGTVVPTAVTGGAEALPAVAEDKELLCPICMQLLKDAFLTACGHSFCYMCIVTHLQHKSDCPCCAQFLTTSQLFPNFLLDKLMKKTFARQLSKTASPVEQFRHSLEQGCEVSVKELDYLLSVVAERKRKLEQEEAEKHLQILSDFLNRLKKQKSDDLKEVQNDLLYIKEDLIAAERHRTALCRARERCSLKRKLVSDDPIGHKSHTSSMGRNISGLAYNFYNPQGDVASVNFQRKKDERNAQVKHVGILSKEPSLSGTISQHTSQSGSGVVRKKRVHAQVRKGLTDKPLSSKDFDV